MSRAHALQIFRAALKAADPEQSVRRYLHLDGDTLKVAGRKYSLHRFDRIQVIGAGKASAAMARAVVRVLGRRIEGGIINVQDGVNQTLRQVELHASGHPIPDERGVAGGQRILEIARDAGPRDLLLCLISGGGSSLVEWPLDPAAWYYGRRRRKVNQSILILTSYALVFALFNLLSPMRLRNA